MEHVWRGIERAQSPVQGGRLKIEWHREPAREQNLEGIAGDDVLLDAAHACFEVRPADRAPRIRDRRRTLHVERGQLDRLSQSGRKAVDLSVGVLVARS
jgi:hypothetical protein